MMTVGDEGVEITAATSWSGLPVHGPVVYPGAVELRRRIGRARRTTDTSPAFRGALEMLDLQVGPPAARAAALDRVLAEARPRDTVTLWHLLTRVDLDQRDRVFDRLAQLVPPPSTVTRDGIRAGRRAMLDDWWDELGLGTAGWWRTWKQPWKDDPALQ